VPTLYLTLYSIQIYVLADLLSCVNMFQYNIQYNMYLKSKVVPVLN
jgi:hypothetical protein